MDIAWQHLTCHTQNQVIQQAGNECIHLANYPLDIFHIHNFICVTTKHDTGKEPLMTSRFQRCCSICSSTRAYLRCAYVQGYVTVHSKVKADISRLKQTNREYNAAFSQNICLVIPFTFLAIKKKLLHFYCYCFIVNVGSFKINNNYWE